METSTPSLTQFAPLPQQLRLLKDIRRNYDYKKGVHEVMLSGSVGCLREDALIETACGSIPIADIRESMHLLSRDHKKNQYCFASSSDAFPKGKDYLYRVIHERGEFVASGNHHIATSDYSYLPVSDLYGQSARFSELAYHEMKYPSFDQRLFVSSALRYWKIISSFLYHCAEHIHQCDPQLQDQLNIVRDAFPLQDDAQVFGQFSYKNKLSHVDALLVLEKEHARIFAVSAHPSMRDLMRLLERQTQGGEVAYSQACSKPYERIYKDIQRYQISALHDAHPKVLLFVLAKLCRFLILSLSSYKTQSSTNGAILSIEKLNKKEWYWDIQVPNTNNYLSNGMIHHNSAKSLTLAHVAVTHCLMYPGARFGIGRLALPSLKNTLCLKIREHLYDSGVDYRYNESTGSFKFTNGSSMPAVSWADNNMAKLGSTEYSGFGIEELTETPHANAYNTLKQRVGRLPHIPEQLLISATNPDAPSHWAYKRIIEKSDTNDLIRVYYSNTFDNPYLPDTYSKNLLDTLDERMAQRMVYGKWIEISSEVIYYAYEKDKNFINQSYKVNERYPIIVSWDFNIGLGKPLSCCFMQYIKGVFHIFNEVVVEGQRTYDSLEEMHSRGLMDYNSEYMIFGDATGRHKDTRSKTSDWDIIDKYFANALTTKTNRHIRYSLKVRRSNPPVRTRHNKVNGVICNANGVRRLMVWKDAPTVDEGLRLTKLKSGAQYVEDDSALCPYQHITTALGYAICGVLSDLEDRGGGFSFAR